MADYNDDMGNGPEGGDVLEQYQKQKMSEQLRGFVRQMKEAMEEEIAGSLVKTMAIKPEWKPLADAMKKDRDAHRELDKQHEISERKAKASYDIFWGTVHAALEDYRAMKYNVATDEIEIYDDFARFEASEDHKDDE